MIFLYRFKPLDTDFDQILIFFPTIYRWGAYPPPHIP